MSGHIYCRELRGTTQQRWYAVIDVAPPGAPRKQLTRAFDTRREARAWAARMAAQRDARKGGPLVGEYLQSWLAGRAAIRPSTAASYRTHLEKYWIPILGDQSLAGLRPEHLQRAHHQLLADGMTPATLARVHATLSAALNTASRQGLLTGNPLAGVELPRVDRVESTIWTLGEARAFLRTIRGDELEALWRLALITGMRRGELLGLSWDDVDLDGWQIRVRTTRITVGATTLEGPPKSRAGRRALHLDWPTVRLLKDVQGQGEALSGHVFVDPNAQPRQPGWVSRRFTQIVAEAGLPRIRFHDLRHTSATLGLAAGESLKAVSKRLGHSDIGITANTYAQVPDATSAPDARRLATCLDQPAARLFQTAQEPLRSPLDAELAPVPTRPKRTA